MEPSLAVTDEILIRHSPGLPSETMVTPLFELELRRRRATSVSRPADVVRGPPPDSPPSVCSGSSPSAAWLWQIGVTPEAVMATRPSTQHARCRANRAMTGPILGRMPRRPAATARRDQVDLTNMRAREPGVPGCKSNSPSRISLVRSPAPLTNEHDQEGEGAGHQRPRYRHPRGGAR